MRVLFGELIRIIIINYRKKNRLTESVENFLIMNYPEIWRRGFHNIMLYSILFFFILDTLVILFNYESSGGRSNFITLEYSQIAFFHLVISLFAVFVIFRSSRKNISEKVRLYFYTLREEKLVVKLHFFLGFIFTLNAVFLSITPYFFFKKKAKTFTYLNNYEAVVAAEFLFYRDKNEEEVYKIINDSLDANLNPKYYKELAFKELQRLAKSRHSKEDGEIIKNYLYVLRGDVYTECCRDDSTRIESIDKYWMGNIFAADKLNSLALANERFNLIVVVSIYLIYTFFLVSFLIMNYLGGAQKDLKVKDVLNLEDHFKELAPYFWDLFSIIFKSILVLSLLYTVFSINYQNLLGLNGSDYFITIIAVLILYLDTFIRYSILIFSVFLFVFLIIFPFGLTYILKNLHVIRFIGLGKQYSPK